MENLNQVTPRVFLHLDSHARKSDGKSKFSVRVDIDGKKKTYRLDLNGRKPILMKKKYWTNVIDPETGKPTREKQILHVKGNPNSKALERQLMKAVEEMENLLRNLADNHKQISHGVLQKLWQRKGTVVFSEWILSWVEGYCREHNRSPRTLEAYQLVALAISRFEESTQARPIQGIDVDWLRRFQNFLYREREVDAEGKYTGLGMAPTTGSSTLSKVGTIFKNALLDGEIAFNPHREFVDRKYFENSKVGTIRFLEEEEIEHLYELYCTGGLRPHKFRRQDGRWYRDGETLHHKLGIFLFTIFTGLRYSDMKKVAEGHPDVNIGKNHLSVVMEKSKRPGKPPKSVRLKITDRMRRVANLSGNGPVFSTPFVTNKRMNSNLRYVLKAAGVDKWISFHDLRRTFATSLLTKGARLKMVSNLMGHSTSEVTESRYAKVVDKSADEAMDLWDNLKSAFTHPNVRDFVEDVFVLLQDNPNVKARKRLLDKIDSLSELLQLDELQTENQKAIKVA